MGFHFYCGSSFIVFLYSLTSHKTIDPVKEIKMVRTFHDHENIQCHSKAIHLMHLSVQVPFYQHLYLITVASLPRKVFGQDYFVVFAFLELL